MIKYLIPTFTLLILDAIYLYTTSPITGKMIQSIQGSPIKFNILPAIICYAIIVLGLYYFIWKNHRPVKDAFLLGVFTYGVYEFTNMATLKNWIPLIAMLDTLWGGVLFALTTFIFYYIEKQLKL
jgi:uncharacterized membrane protein